MRTSAIGDARRRTGLRRCSSAAACATAALLLTLFAPAAAGAWAPESPSYGVGETANVPVTMGDGVVVRANVFYPTDPGSGAPAAGPFPVVMVQDPYGKDTTGAASGTEGGAEAATETGALPYLITRGYIDVVAEVRGTGGSEGAFNLLDPVQAQDGATLVRWAAGLPHADGRVGLYGPSYMGINQFTTASALGPDSPLKALFPIVAGNDTYRDIAFDGGIPDGEADLALTLSVFGGLEVLNPFAEDAQSLSELIKVESQHAPALLSYNASQLLNVAAGGDQAYDGAYWQQRAPRNMLAQVVSNHLPAFMVGGWFDLYQRGGLLNYTGLQNDYAGRSVGAPMLPQQPVTGRYQLLYGPWYHLDAGTGVDIYRLELAWFDRWLKNEPTGIETTTTPLHLYELGANRWVDLARMPLEQSRPQTFYLAAGPSGSAAPSDNDGRLEPQRPPAGAGSDEIVFNGATSPCSRSSEQWGAGALQLALELGQLPPDPCAQDDRSVQAGPGALTYTSAPFDHAVALAGPIDVTLFASSSATDSEWVASIEDVAADGSSVPLSSGALLGSFRALDADNSWSAPDGSLLMPYHPFSQESVQPVLPGTLTRYDIEVFPTFARLGAGHRLRLTLNTSDTPHLLPTVPQLERLAGGVYSVERNAAAASYVELPLSADTFPSANLAPVAAVRANGCLARRRTRIALGAERLKPRSLVVRLNGRRIRALAGLRPRVVVDLRRLRGPTATFVVTGRTLRGRRYHRTLRFHVCS